VTAAEVRAKAVRMLASGSRWPEITELCASHGFRCYIRSAAERAEIVVESPRTYYAGDSLNPAQPETVSLV
jgi:hypothetical protein